MTDTPFALGRIEVIDERDKNFPISTVLKESDGSLPYFPKRYWWSDGWWGNQGPMPFCVAYAWMHYLEDGPVIQDVVEGTRSKPFYNPKDFYDLCQLHDQWPGECVDTDTECLTTEGWKRYDELQIGDSIYSFNLDIQKAEWAQVTKVNIFHNRNIISFSNSHWDIRVTENHKWVVRNRINKTPYRLVETGDLNTSHSIPVTAKCANLPTNKTYTDSFVKLIAWIATEGHIRKTINTERRGNGISISQKKYKEQLIRVLKENDIINGSQCNDGLFSCEFSGEMANKVRSIISEDKNIDLNFIYNLTYEQLELFIHECILGDGSIINDPHSNRQTRLQFHQNINNGNVLDVFILSCILCNKSISKSNTIHYVNKTKNTDEIVETWSINTKESMDIRKLKQTVVNNVTVWCPTTTNGTFLARRGGKIFYTGNSYNGTSVRAGAKILNHLDIVKAYRWAFTLEDVVKTVKYIGPMVVGTRWYSNMSQPSSAGLLSASGTMQGGHAYLINGLDDDLGLFRIKNSWGREWGKEGYAFLPYDDFEMLLNSGGEACIAFENKMEDVPELLFS